MRINYRTGIQIKEEKKKKKELHSTQKQLCNELKQQNKFSKSDPTNHC